MKKATIIRDRLSGQPFAILLPSNGKKLVAFGSSGQGKLWADWAMLSSTAVLDNLDVSLAVEKDVELTDEFLNSLESTFSVAEINDLKFALSKKAILTIQQTKSLANEGLPGYEQINEENEEEDVENWPIVDAAIATIDIAYKQIALDYKAKAFNLDSKRSSILLQTKGVRAMWDPNMPGGGGWRCPDATPYGGQFTNRLGRGCTFGAIRRIGRALMTASLRDIAKGFNDDDVAFPSIYRTGKKLDEIGDKLKQRTGRRYARRAKSRAYQLQKEKTRLALKKTKPTFRQRYESLGPTVSRRNRVLIAAAQTARAAADDQITRGFIAESRRLARRQGLPTPKQQTPSMGGDNDVPGGVSGAMSAQRRAAIADKLRNTAQNILDSRRFSRRQKRAESKQKEKLDGDELINRQNSIINRYLRGHLLSRITEKRNLQRELRGRVPKSTTRLRERIALRSRRRAIQDAGEIPTLEDYPDFEKTKMNRAAPVGGNRTVSEFRTTPLPREGAKSRAKWFTGLEVATTEGIIFEDSVLTAGESRELKRPKVDFILRDMEKHLSEDDTDNAVKGLDDLDRFFKAELNHAAIARLREDSLNDYDREHQDKLRELYELWQKSFNDPKAPPPKRGGLSNMAKTEQTDEEWVVPGEAGFLFEGRSSEDLDKIWLSDYGIGEHWLDPALEERFKKSPPVGQRTILRATDFPNRPIIYVEDSEAEVAHLMTVDGKHLMSLVTSHDQDGKPKINFIAGSAAMETITRETMPKRYIKWAGRERRRIAALQKRVAQIKAFRKRFNFDDDNQGVTIEFFGKTTSGLRVSRDALNNIPMNETVKQKIFESIDKNLTILENRIRIALDFPDRGKPISVLEAGEKLKNIRAQSGRQAGLIETDLTNMLTLTRAQESENLLYINDLKPQLRNKIITEDFPTAYIDPKYTNPKKRYDFFPLSIMINDYDESASKRPDSALYLEYRPLKPKSPLMVTENLIAPSPPMKGTGPDLIPGVGNPDLGIHYDASSGLYIDSATGEYIEDYSNLPIDETAIYDPILPDETKRYPRVQVSPAGVLPSRFVTLAPGTNPAIVAPNEIHTKNFKDAIDVYVESQILSPKSSLGQRGVELRPSLSKVAAEEKVLGNPLREGLKSNLLIMVDARNWQDSKENGEPTGRPPELGLIKLGELQKLAQDSITANPDLPITELGFSFATLSERYDLRDTHKRLGSTTTLAPWLEGRGIYGEWNIAQMGLNVDMKPSIFYAPSELVSGQENVKAMYGLVADLNKALQLQHQVDTNPSGVRSDLDQDVANLAWSEAAKSLSYHYQVASRNRNDALNELNANPKNKTQMLVYLSNGARADAAKMLLDRHITSNPVALNAIKVHRQSDLEHLARARNIRRRLQIERQLARKNKQIPRNVGAFDNNPEILDPWDPSHQNVPDKPRSLDEILAVQQQHTSEGLFDDPMAGLMELAPEQIDALADMQILIEKAHKANKHEGDGEQTWLFTGLQGTPLYGENYQFSDRERVLHAHFWYVNGASSLPVLINEAEMLSAATELDASGIRRAIVIARGFKQTIGDPRLERQWHNDYLRGERFVVGEGGTNFGRGEYWSFQPHMWSVHHGRFGSLIALVTEKSNIFSNDIFRALFSPYPRTHKFPDTGRRTALRAEGDYNGGNHIGALLGTVYSALGFPGLVQVEGLNPYHVNRREFRADLLPSRSILPDPKTGQWSQSQIDKVQDFVADLTRVGNDVTITQNGDWHVDDSWGIATLEGLLRDSNYGQAGVMLNELRPDQLRAFFRDIPNYPQPQTPLGYGNRNQEIIEETKILRQKINAWFAQNLSWLVQLMQMRQDESLPGQAGIEAKEWNKKLDYAMKSLVEMSAESRASMFGIDMLIGDYNEVLPSELWRQMAVLRPSDDPQGPGNAILMQNRSALIVLRDNIHYRNFGDKLRQLQIRDPNGNLLRDPDGNIVSPIQDRNWGDQ